MGPERFELSTYRLSAGCSNRSKLRAQAAGVICSYSIKGLYLSSVNCFWCVRVRAGMGSPYVRKQKFPQMRAGIESRLTRLILWVRHVWSDLSTWVLVLTNVITISAAYVQQWPFSTILWVYWCQTLIIGFFAFFRAISLADLSPGGVEHLSRRLHHAGRLRAGVLFLAHFTLVQFCLTFTLWALIGPIQSVKLSILIPSALLFFGNHLFSYVYHKKSDRIIYKNIGLSFFRPYLRLLPILVSLLFAGMVIAAFYLVRDQQLVPVAFLMLFVCKTGADVSAHRFEHGLPSAFLSPKH